MRGFKGITALLQPKNLGLLCCIAVIGIIIATLWPFDFCPGNDVKWVQDVTGVRFSGNGVILSKTPLGRSVVGPASSCSFEILLRPARITSKSLGTIVSFYSASTSSELMFFRQGDNFEMSRGFLNGLKQSKSPRFGVRNIFENGKLLLLTITSGRDGTTIYKNGEQTRIVPQFQFAFSAADLTGQIILGTSAIHYFPYSGEILGLAIYGRELTQEEVRRDFETWTSERALAPRTRPGALAVYSFDEGTGNLIHSAVGSAPDLKIPRQFAVPHKPFLESPSEEVRYEPGYALDVAENVLGFMPLGFIFCMYFATRQNLRNSALYATLVSGALSLAVEIAQFYVPPRGSNITDIITNTAGAALGALLAGHVHSKLNRLTSRAGPAPAPPHARESRSGSS